MDLDSNVDKHQTDVALWHAVTPIDWTSLILVQRRRSASTFLLFFVAADAYSRPFCEFFCWANVNSFLWHEPNNDNIIQQLFWADN